MIILAIDHFGDDFARPDAVEAVGEVTFSRPTDTAGDVTIPLGTIIKTVKDANGEEIRFLTDAEVIMTGTTIDADITADDGGSDGNVLASTITVLETALTDPTVVVDNAAAMAGGANEQNDSTYRETIRDLIEALKGATTAAVRGALEAVQGISTVTLIEQLKTVKEWDIGAGAVVGDFFRIAYPFAYIADENGNATQTLIDNAQDAIDSIRACGVRIVILGASGSATNWSADLTLNPAGPNYATLQTDLTMIEESMESYMNELPIGSGFDKSAASAAMLAIWGAAGTDDLTAFSTTIPAADIAGVTGTKLVAGTIAAS